MIKKQLVLIMCYSEKCQETGPDEAITFAV